ncbi:MAG: hypoxanthine phosphoribosyltransferase [Vampirovibrionales bacterium]
MIAETTPLSYEHVCKNLELYIDKAQLNARIQELAMAINERYAGVEELTILCVLKGSFMFASDLVKYLNVPCQLEFIRLASYGDSMHSSGEVKSVNLTLPNLADKHVLVLEDIIDTGLTLSFLMNYLRNLHHTKSLALAVLLDKAECRKPEAKDIICDFVGFQIDNDFVVGYGLDFAGYFRNLPEIYRYSILNK